MKVSTLFAKSFNLTTNIEPNANDRCGICGFVERVASLKTIIGPSTADLADTFRHGNYVCLDCATCFGQSKKLAGNLYADATTAQKPVVALKSATEDRPAWRNLVRQLSPDMDCVAIVTSNTKRRLWPQAVVSRPGSQWRVLFVDGDNERIITVDYIEVLRCLDLIESLLNLGYSKRAIGDNLLNGVKFKNLLSDIQSVMADERRIGTWRGTDEFSLALFIAQKDS